MDWKSIGKDLVLKGLPLLGTALGGPGGGLVAGLVTEALGLDSGEPDAVVAAIQADPQAMINLKSLEYQHREKLAGLALDAAKLETESAMTQIKSVNATMQVEAASEHWPQYSWRPFNGFLFGIAVVLIYFILPLNGKPVPSVPEFIWLGWGAILGVTTWDRGKAKRAAAGDTSAGPLVGLIQAIKG